MAKYLKFWGTRGSCPVSGPLYQRFGGNTSCLEIRYDDTHLIIDAGTGIRPLGEEMVKHQGLIHLFLSHTHWDHVIGFPFFAPLYSPDTEIAIWAPFENHKSCREIVEELLFEEFFSVRLDQLRAKLHFHSIEGDRSIPFGPLVIHFHQSHHPSTAFCFKIQTPNLTIGYGTDNEMFKGFHGQLREAPLDTSIVQFFYGSDLLIHEAQYFPEEYRYKVGWGHSSVSNAAALAYQANIKRWLVIHHDPKHTDEDLIRLSALAQNLFNENGIECHSEWIGDGYTLPL